MTTEQRWRQLDPRHREIRAGAFACVYCGGGATGRTVEHMPPRSLFDGWRPYELVFPACRACNRASSALDTIVAFMARFSAPEPKPERADDLLGLLRSVDQNFPEILLAFGPRGDDAVQFDSPYVHRSLQLFGTKLGLALLWRETRQVIPPQGGVLVTLFTNADELAGAIPAAVTEMSPALRTLVQGRQHVRDQFEFDSHFAVDADVSVHLAWFRKTFALLAYANADASGLPPIDGSVVLRPGCLREGYPFGLPRLPPDELAWRRERQRQMFAARWGLI